MKAAENKNPSAIPYALYEQEQMRSNGIIIKLWVIVIVLIVALLGTNIAWLVYEKQFETVEEITSEVIESVEVVQENENGNNNYVGHDGDINNG